MIIVRAICASFRERGSCGVFSLIIFRFLGFLIILRTVGSRLTLFFSLIKFIFCSSSSERLRLVGSFGTVICELFCSLFSDLIFLE